MANLSMGIRRRYASISQMPEVDSVVANEQTRPSQLTPPGSTRSIQYGKNLLGKNVASASPGSAQELHLIVSSLEMARNDLISREIDASEVSHRTKYLGCRLSGTDEYPGGLSPEHSSYRLFVCFRDPDGNGWLLQEITARLPGRFFGNTAFVSADELSRALKRAAAAHRRHEARIGRGDPDWADWYGHYLSREQAGKELPL